MEKFETRKWEVEIIQELNDGPRTRVDLITATGAHDMSIRRALKRLMDNSVIERKTGTMDHRPVYIYFLTDWGRKVARGEI